MKKVYIALSLIAIIALGSVFYFSFSSKRTLETVFPNIINPSNQNRTSEKPSNVNPEYYGWSKGMAIVQTSCNPIKTRENSGAYFDYLKKLLSADKLIYFDGATQTLQSRNSEYAARPQLVKKPIFDAAPPDSRCIVIIIGNNEANGYVLYENEEKKIAVMYLSQLSENEFLKWKEDLQSAELP